MGCKCCEEPPAFLYGRSTQHLRFWAGVLRPAAICICYSIFGFPNVRPIPKYRISGLLNLDLRHRLAHFVIANREIRNHLLSHELESFDRGQIPVGRAG